MNTYRSKGNCVFSTARWKRDHVSLSCSLYILKILCFSVQNSFPYVAYDQGIPGGTDDYVLFMIMAATHGEGCAKPASTWPGCL